MNQRFVFYLKKFVNLILGIDSCLETYRFVFRKLPETKFLCTAPLLSQIHSNVYILNQIKLPQASGSLTQAFKLMKVNCLEKIQKGNFQC